MRFVVMCANVKLMLIKWINEWLFWPALGRSTHDTHERVTNMKAFINICMTPHTISSQASFNGYIEIMPHQLRRINKLWSAAENWTKLFKNCIIFTSMHGLIWKHWTSNYSFNTRNNPKTPWDSCWDRWCKASKWNWSSYLILYANIQVCMSKQGCQITEVAARGPRRPWAAKAISWCNMGWIEPLRAQHRSIHCKFSI